VAALAGSLAGARSLALDTESDSFYHYFEKVCLLQIAGPEDRVWLVDPLAARDLAPLAPFAADPAVEKVLHGSENDVALLRRGFGFEFAGVFDTRTAAQLCGKPEIGLQALLAGELGVTVGKAHQRCDWSRRPLSPAEERYAAEDVRHLVALRDRLQAQLARLGREAWAREEFEELARTPAAPVREPADFAKAKGARELAPRELGVLRELFSLREEWARRADVPLFKLAGDEALVALAVGRPRDRDTLLRVRGISARLKERRAPEILEAIRKGESEPEDLSKRPRGPRLRMGRESSAAVDRLKAWRSEAAPRLGVDPGVLLPQRVIERIAIERPRTLEELAAVPGVRRWRIETFGKELVAAARG
jgi:ribonuclease D